MLKRRRLYLQVWAACALTHVGCHETVLHDLDEPAANEVVAALQQRGLPASKVDDGHRGFAVEVPRGTLAVSVSALQEAGLPRRASPEASDLLGGDSLIRSPIVEQALVNEAQAQELRQALRMLPNVVDASVRLALPRGKPASAAVVLTWTAPQPLTAVEVAGIVAAAVPELAPEQVVVTLREMPKTQQPFEFANIGPFIVARQDEARVRSLLWAVTAGLALVGATATTVALRRRY